MNSSSRPIGVFDSGVGGLTVVKEIQKYLPWKDILYFGDTARLPYGNKSEETVLRYSSEISNFLIGQGVEFIVVACNTSSAYAIERLKSELDIPVLGMIEPGAKGAVEATKNGLVGLIGTRATVASGSYERCISAIDPKIRVYSTACPLFVPLVEEGWAQDHVALEVADRYLSPLLEKNVDTIILGCTHYPVLIPVIRQVIGDRVKLVSSAETAASWLAHQVHPAVKETTECSGGLGIFVTDSGTYFREVAENILGQKINKLIKVEEERLVINAH